MWTLWHIITPCLIPQLQSQFVGSTSLAFNANQGTTSERTVLTTVVLTATGQSQVITDLSVLSKSVGCTERRDILSPTAFSMMTGMITTSLRMRDMLGTESVTQGNEGNSVTVFLSFLSSPYGLTISPSMYGYNITWSPM